METKSGNHWSDCATHNEPAFPNGPCDCGGNAPHTHEKMEAPALPYVLRSPKEVVDAVNEYGTINALQGYVELKRMENEVAEAIGKLREKATEQAAAYGKGEHEAFGAIIQCRASAGKWDFSSLPWYPEVQSMQTNVDMLRKAKEDMAKTAFKALEKMQPLPMDMETGEQIQPATYTPGRDTVAITLPKTKQ